MTHASSPPARPDGVPTSRRDRLALALLAGRRGLGARPAAVLRRRPDRARARDRRTRPARSRGTSACSTTWPTTCSSTSRREPSNTRARNINTIDEVPDSSWFTNRIGTRAADGRRGRARPRDRAGAGPGALDDHPREVVGRRPGFTARGRQRRDVVRLVRSARRTPKGATGAMVVATKIFWALGYNQVETS